jgi:hypothetical protein
MTVYICGDSFGSSDPEYGACWTDLLAQQIELANLSRVCASNLHIGLQVDQAIADRAEYIIYLATSSIREDVLLQEPLVKGPLLTRFADITNPDLRSNLTSYSIHSLNSTTLFNSAQLQQLREYHAEFFDIDLAVYRNELIIEGTLSRLVASGIPFAFDQGGFEHPRFSGSRQGYFSAYTQYRSELCLWDYAEPGPEHRPYYHITDSIKHTAIADYYLGLIRDKT